jgi:amino acid adenylation domain-containing protein
VSPSLIHPAGPFEGFGREQIEQSIPARFEAQVALHSARPAVVTRDRAVSYAELNQLANCVAHTLLAARGEGEEIVALLFGQGVPLVAAILGTLKAGKIYLPIDPALPAAHVVDLLRDAEAKVILTERPDRALFVQLPDVPPRAIAWDDVRSDTPDKNPGLALEPDRLAYVYYTSGSTGRPKGVADSHRNVLHNIMRYTNGLLIGPHDRLTLMQSPGFSGAVSSLFSALLNGAAVHPIVPAHESPQTLADWVREHHLTMWHSVPSLFRHLCAAGGTFPSVRVVRLEGDQALPLDAALHRVHFAHDCVLVNGLGATETGLTRRFIVRKDTPITGNVLPVGFAVDDMEIAVLDDEGRPVATGEVGEVAVRSRFLAVGYWKRPELTSERFQACPDDAAQRLYRTGDLGRMTADGCLALVGRKDFQVKILGTTVDLSAVEAALTSTPGVEQAVVMAHTDEQGESRLVAYLVPSEHPAPRTNALRKALAARLPPHMVPSAYIVLARIPLDENGKVSRRELPAPPATRPDLDKAFAAPASATEQWIAGVWQELLGIDGIGLDDSFFELGGQSLALARLLGRVGLPLTSLGRALTVREMAREIDRKGHDND